MRLVDDARRAWRWFSVQCMALALTLQGAWEAMPDDMKSGIPPRAVTLITLSLLALGIVGRLVKQEKP
jgi:hypothetical protein